MTAPLVFSTLNCKLFNFSCSHNRKKFLFLLHLWFCYIIFFIFFNINLSHSHHTHHQKVLSFFFSSFWAGFLSSEVLILLLFTLSILISLFSTRFGVATFIFFSVLISLGILFFSLPLLSSEFSSLYKISNDFTAILSLNVLLESWLDFFLHLTC